MDEEWGRYWPFKGTAQLAEHRQYMQMFSAQIFKDKWSSLEAQSVIKELGF